MQFHHLYLIRPDSRLCAALHSSLTRKLRKVCSVSAQHAAAFRLSDRNTLQHNITAQ